MNTEELKKGIEACDLALYISGVAEELRQNKKFPAVHAYLSTLHSFARFSGEGGMPLPMDEVFTAKRLKEYQDWLLRRKLSQNTVSSYLSTLRAVYNRWMPAGTPGHNPKLFGGMHIKVVSRTKRALTLPQISLLVADACTDARRTPNARPSLTDEQQTVLAYFLLMFMLRGMPFIDLAHLRKSDYRPKEAAISYSRHKTGKPMLVDIPPEAMALLLRCRDKTDSPYLFPILDADVQNAAQLYRCYRDALRRFNRTLMQLMSLLLPGIKVSSYTARYTWATLAYHRGIPVGIISQALGHSSIQVTMNYLKPFDNKILDKVNRQVIADAKRYKKKKDEVHCVLRGRGLE